MQFSYIDFYSMLDCKRRLGPQNSILLLKPIVRCFGPGRERSWDSAWEYSFYNPKVPVPIEGPVVREAEIHAETLSLPIQASLFAKKLN